MNSITQWFLIHWLRFEYQSDMVNAYLAQMRGNHHERAEFQCRAYDAQRKLQVLRLNQIYGSLR